MVLSAAEERARSILASLPHVHQDKIDSFMAYAAKRSMDPLFHAKRCTAFGASEVGALARHADLRNPLSGGAFFSTAEDVVATKTLERFPFPGNVYTRRGQLLEPAIRYAMRRTYGATTMKDELNAIMLANDKDTKLPWLKISPDDLLKIDGRTYIPDYKMPSDTSGDMEDDYGWQLHAYKMAAYEKAGVSVDGILLVRGVLPVSTGLESANWLEEGKQLGQQEYINRLARVATLFQSGIPGFGLKVEEVTYDPAKGERIKELTSHYWHEYVQKGVLPSSEPTEPLDLDAAETERLKRLQDHLSVVLAAKSKLDDQEKALKAELQEVIGSAPTPITSNSQFPESLVKPSMTRSIDWEGVQADLERRGVDTSGAVIQGKNYRTDVLLQTLDQLNVDTSDPRFIETTLDTKALTKLVDENDVDVSGFVEYKPRFMLARDKKTTELVSTLKSDFEDTFLTWSDQYLNAEGEVEECEAAGTPAIKFG